MSDTSELPKCACGHTRYNKGPVIADCEYSIWGTMQLLMGGSVVPKKARFRCVQCGREVETVTDAETLKKDAGELY